MPQIITKPKGTKGVLSVYGGSEEFISINGSNPEDHQIFLYGGTGAGKSLAVDFPVLGKNGYIPIGDIKIGDYVYSKDGKLTKVLGVYPQGELDIYKVSFSDGSYAECSLDHLWEVETRYIRGKNCNSKWEQKNRPNLENWMCNKPVVVTTREIMDSLSKKYSIPLTSPVEFPKKDLPLDPYLLGLLLGDGGLSNNIVRFSTVDTEILCNMSEVLPLNVFIKSTDRCNYILTTNQYRNPLITELKRLGLMGTKSNTKYIPKDYLFSSVEDRVSILQGLLDTDGSTSKNNIEFCTVSSKLKDGVVHLVQSLGGVAKVTERYTKYTYKGERKTGKLSYRIVIKLPNSISPFRLRRKTEKLTPRKYIPYRYITNVEYTGKKECVCIKVDHPSETFLIKDFVVTHNTVTCCLKLFLLGIKYPGMKALVTRNSYVALVKSALSTFETVVQKCGYTIGKKNAGPNVIYRLGESKPTEYRFPYSKYVDNDPNSPHYGRVYEGESRILISSLSNAKDELGAEYDYVYVNQPELISESDWEFLVTRANGRRGHVPYPMLFGDPNPENERHWIWKGGKGTGPELDDNILPVPDTQVKLGMGERWKLIRSVYTDNPTIWDHKLGCFTKEGEGMIYKLKQSLSPIMYQRLIRGEWCSFEGLVFGDVLDRDRHLRPRSEYMKRIEEENWDRYWCFDFGYDDPFTFHIFAKNPHKEEYVCYRYMVHRERTINDHVETILDNTIGEPRPKLIVADRNPESISILEQALGMNIVSAKKGPASIKAGINVLIDMLKNDELIFLEDSLVEEDLTMRNRKEPIGFIEEAENYRWDQNKKEEIPIGGQDHCIDPCRYLFTFIKASQKTIPFIWL